MDGCVPGLFWLQVIRDDISQLVFNSTVPLRSAAAAFLRTVCFCDLLVFSHRDAFFV